MVVNGLGLIIIVFYTLKYINSFIDQMFKL